MKTQRLSRHFTSKIARVLVSGLICITAVLPCRSAQTPPYWDAAPATSSLGGGEHTPMVFYNGALYVLLGQTYFWPNTVARWTKCGGWQVIGSLGSANPNVDPIGGSLCLGGDGGHYLYVGGQFDWVDSVAVNNVAKFDLSTGVWSPVGDGSLTRPAFSLAADLSGTVYAGFPPWAESPGVLSTELLKVCTANTWAGLGGGLIESMSARDPYGVSALASYGSTIYAAGDFDGSATVSSFNVIKWDGSWHSMETADNWTYSFGPWMEWVAADDQNVFVAGSFAGADGISPAGIARFSTAGTPIPIDRLLSHQWGAQPGFGRALTMQTESGNTYVAGTFDSVESMSAAGIAKWASSLAAWSPLGSGLTYADGTPATGTGLACNRGAVYVAGNFAFAGGVPAQGIARWVTGPSPDSITSCSVTLSDPVPIDHCNASITVTGQIGSHWWISGSPDQVNWQVIGDVTLWNGSATITDPNACDNRYYMATNLCCVGSHH